MLNLIALWFFAISEMPLPCGTITVSPEIANQIEIDQRRWLEMSAAEQVAEMGKHYGAELVQLGFDN
jgi:hypothetical protein